MDVTNSDKTPADSQINFNMYSSNVDVNSKVNLDLKK